MKSVNLGKRETPDLMAATPALAEELGITVPELAHYGQNLIRSNLALGQISYSLLPEASRSQIGVSSRPTAEI